ncbi:MAG: hypothetical protein RLZZ283_634 [Candidatus Parcubacteria bacterium]|jgi:hypothetical protein
MGKNRERAMTLISNFEAQLTEITKKAGRDRFTFSSKAKRQLIDVARRRNIGVDTVLAEMRPKLEELVLRPDDTPDHVGVEVEIFTIQNNKRDTFH